MRRRWFGCPGRWIEIGVALVLTMAALLFVVWTVWAAEHGGISVTDAWVRPTIGEGRTTAAYMTITNDGNKDDVLQVGAIAKGQGGRVA